MRTRNLQVAGVMTGTSGDGVDICMLDFPLEEEGKWKVRVFASYPFEEKFSRKIILFQEKNTMEKREYLSFSAEAARTVALILKKFFEEHFEEKIPDTVVVAYHGQTVGHYPGKVRIAGRELSLTMQAGEGAMIAEETGRTTIGDFRQGDVSSGGEGAPLTPLFHRELLAREKGMVGFLNIGGIGNITLVEEGEVIAATDTGPGNMLIDGAVHLFSKGKARYDRNGRWGRQGSVSAKLLEYITLNDPFRERDKPASTGREEYGERFLSKLVRFGEDQGLSEEDVIATVTSYTAVCVKDFLDEGGYGNLEKVYVGGGGACNDLLMEMLSSLLDHRQIVSSNSLGIPPEYVEAASFAYLGYCCLRGIPLDTSPFTGGGTTILGKIIPGANYNNVMKLIFGTSPNSKR